MKTQARDLFAEARDQLNQQATTQQDRAATGLRSMSDELQQMANNSEEQGMATDLVQRAAGRTGRMASWLGERDPESVLDEVRRFARRRPLAFIGIAAAAGLLAGRLTRSLTSESGGGGSSRPQGTSTTPPAARSVPVQTDAATPIYDQTRTAGSVDGQIPEGGGLR